MERANKVMKHRLKKVGQNLGFSEKRDELEKVQHVDQRNQKITAAISTYRKNIANCLKTGSKEDEKKKKKLDEYSLMTDLINESQNMEANSCLARVMKKIGDTINRTLDERIHLEQNLERNVIDQLTKYLEMDKSLSKSKEKLNNLTIDVDIARKGLHNAEKETKRQAPNEEEKIRELQDQLDNAEMKLDTHKDATITEIFSLAAKEKEIAKHFSKYIEEQIEYHRSTFLLYENAMPEILREIENAEPRPVFGVNLEDHLRNSNRTISLVIEKCCSMLKQNGFNEKGLFRVNGNNTRIKRMKAAFDAGQIEIDIDDYIADPNSVCSVLKSYLRELPEPLLSSYLFNDWSAAIKLEGNERVEAMQRLLHELPVANLNNLTYLINFLSELLNYQDVTMMNASNLSIVFGPNLINGNNAENDNYVGTRVVELLLLNAGQLFGSAHAIDAHDKSKAHGVKPIANSPAGSTSFSSASSESSLITRSLSSPTQGNNSTVNDSLSVDTNTYKNKQMTELTSPFAVSPSMGRANNRPKQPAPLPPPTVNSIRAELESIILPSMPLEPTRPQTRPFGSIKEKSYTSAQREQVSATFPATNQQINHPIPMSSPTEYDNVPMASRNFDLLSSEMNENEIDHQPIHSHNQSPSQGSIDSLIDYIHEPQRNDQNKQPYRPPPPVVRTQSNSLSQRPNSYQSAIQNATPNQFPTFNTMPSMTKKFPVVDVSQGQQKTSSQKNVTTAHRPPIVHDSENRTLITLESSPLQQSSNPITSSTLDRPQRGNKPPLPIKPKQDEFTKL